MKSIEALLGQPGTCQIGMDVLTTERHIRVLGKIAGILVGLEFGASDPQQQEMLGEIRADLAELRNTLLIGRRMTRG